MFIQNKMKTFSLVTVICKFLANNFSEANLQLPLDHVDEEPHRDYLRRLASKL